MRNIAVRMFGARCHRTQFAHKMPLAAALSIKRQKPMPIVRHIRTRKTTMTEYDGRIILLNC